MNSESWTMERGSTMEARDFVERFPLVTHRQSELRLQVNGGMNILTFVFVARWPTCS